MPCRGGQALFISFRAITFTRFSKSSLALPANTLFKKMLTHHSSLLLSALLSPPSIFYYSICQIKRWMADVRYKLCAKGDSTRPYRPPLPMLFFSGANCYSAIFMVSHHCAPIKGSLLSARKCNIEKKRKCPPLVSCVSSKQENEQTLLKIFCQVWTRPFLRGGKRSWDLHTSTEVTNYLHLLFCLYWYRIK